MKKIIYTLIAIAFVFSACRKDKIDAGGTAVQNVAGEFWTQVDNGSGYGNSYFKLSTYNTAANSPTEMWIDDNGEYYEFKGKINVDANAGTFSGTNVVNEYYDMTFNITNGKITKDAVKAPGSGVTTDEITFDATFSDDPGTVYHFKGYRRTKFLSDDH